MTNDPKEDSLNFATLPPVESGSRLRAEWRVAWGHLKSKKADAALSVVTVLAMLGVLLSVASMNVVTSVMTGFSDDLRDKILGANAHVVVFRQGGALVDYERATKTIGETPGVAAASPFVFSELMIRSNWSHTGVIIKGVDPQRVADVTHVRDDLRMGYDGALTTEAQRTAVIRGLAGTFEAKSASLQGQEPEKPLPGILLGHELASQLQVASGDKVQLINPIGGGVGPMGLSTPTVRLLRVAGVFDSGMYEYDTKWAYISIPVAQDFLGMGDTVTGVEVRVREIDRAEDVSYLIQEALGSPYYARHWKELNGKLFEALEMEKFVAQLLFIIVVSIAGSLIVSTLLMVVLTKGREIAILKAMGAPPMSIVRIFMMQGTAIGLTGTAAGTALGLAACRALERYPIPISTDVYYLSTVPIVVDTDSVARIAFFAFAACFVLTIYPAWRAGRIDPVAALRYE